MVGHETRFDQIAAEGAGYNHGDFPGGRRGWVSFKIGIVMFLRLLREVRAWVRGSGRCDGVPVGNANFRTLDRYGL